MKNQDTQQMPYEMEDERLHKFFQDLAAALNRITEKDIQPDPGGQGLPTPVSDHRIQRKEGKRK